MSIDPRIEADTLPVTQTSHSSIRLMNDSRWPWLIILPRNSTATELHDLEETQRIGFLSDINRCSEIMQIHTRCQSVNVAMLGNVVSALHCHVVARNAGDPNWPKPVWGFENSIAYEEHLPNHLLQAIQDRFLV